MTMIETDDQILRRIEAAEATVEVATRNIKSAKADLLERREKEIQLRLKEKDEPFGDVTIIVGNHEVKITVPKKVTWDNKMLAAMYKEITASGENAAMYVDTDYSISETTYKKFSDDIRDFFVSARTVTPGNPSLKIVKEKV